MAIDHSNSRISCNKQYYISFITGYIVHSQIFYPNGLATSWYTGQTGRQMIILLHDVWFTAPTWRRLSYILAPPLPLGSHASVKAMAGRRFQMSRNNSLQNAKEKSECLVWNPNFSEKMSSLESYTLVTTTVLNGITSFPAIFGNIFILLVLVRRPQIRSNSHVLLGCLALTDVLVGIIVQPFLVAISIQCLTFNGSSCLMYVIYDITKYVCGLCSSCVSFLVSAERYFAISFPYRYAFFVTKTRVLVACACVWITGITVAIARLFTRRGKPFGILFIVFLSVSFIIVTLLYLKMLHIANRHRVQINTQDRTLTKQRLRERKALKTTMTIIAVYLLCYLPYIIARLYFVNAQHKRTFRYVVMLWPKTLLYINSSLNPFILFWRLRKVRKALWETLSFVPFWCCARN